MYTVALYWDRDAVVENIIKDKTILILGGTGAIGSRILSEVLRFQPHTVRIYSRDDTKQALLREEYREHTNIRFLIGDVRDAARLRRGMEGVDIVFHAAALKHVLACEYNPFEAVKTNIVGTQNIIDSAMDVEPEMVVFTSTDKAVNPCNAMGTSKLMAERLITAANYYKGPRRTVFASVRFGNVVGSRGSVVPLFKRQIEAGGPVTLTSRQMTRFVMIDHQAVRLLFRACSLAQGGEVFVVKMPVVNILDLAEVMIERHGAPEIEIMEIGVKPGEKIYEELITTEEHGRTLELKRMFVVLPAIRDFLSTDFHYPEAKPFPYTSYRSDQFPPITREAVSDLLVSSGLA